MAAGDRLAGSLAWVSPGTAAWVTMMAGTPASMARSNGTRSFARSSSTGARVGSLSWGSGPPEPMPGQCFTTEVMPASVWAATTAFTKEDTAAGSSPKLRVPRPDPDPTSATGPKFMVKPSSFMPAACSPSVVAASSGVPVPRASADGILPRASRSRCTVPPSSSAATVAGSGASATAVATWSPMSAVWLPFRPNPPTVPPAMASVARVGEVTIVISSWAALASGGSMSAQSGGLVVVVRSLRSVVADRTSTWVVLVPVQAPTATTSIPTAAARVHLGRARPVASAGHWGCGAPGRIG